MILIEEKHVRWIEGLSPVITAMTTFKRDWHESKRGRVIKTDLKLKGCGHLDEIEEGMIWAIITEENIDLGKLRNLNLACLMGFAEYYDMALIRNYIRIKFYGTNIETAAAAIVHLETPGCLLEEKTSGEYLGEAAKLCGTSKTELTEMISEMGEIGRQDKLTTYLTNERIATAYRAKHGLEMGCKNCKEFFPRKNKCRDRTHVCNLEYPRWLYCRNCSTSLYSEPRQPRHW